MQAAANLTTTGVRKCYLDAHPRWPLQEDNWFEALANACAKECDRHAMHMGNAALIQESRRRWQAVRQAVDVILEEMPPTIEELETTVEELGALGKSPMLAAGRRHLLALHEAAKRAKPALERIRDPGGQPSQRVAFARRIARHVLATWDQQGFRESLHADGPFIAFLARLLNDIYGGETDHEALAKALRRDEDIKQLASRRNRT